jgi:hypothetical protein
MRVTYTAKRALASGHSASTSYNLDMYTQEPQRTYAPTRKRAVAIDGTEENLLLRIESTWSVTTDQFKRTGSAPTSRDLFIEFFASVMGGEQFIFDPYRLPGGGADVLPLNVTIVNESVQLIPIDPSLGIYTATFSVREVAAVT